MEHKEKNTFLLAAAVAGFVYWGLVILPFFADIITKTESSGIQMDSIKVGFFKGLANFIKNTSFNEIKWFLLGVLIIVAIITPSILNLIGWKKNSKLLVIISMPLYFISLNFLSLLLCVFGILRSTDNGFSIQDSIQEKKKKPLLAIAGILEIIILALLITPLIKGTADTPLFLTVIGLYFIVALIVVISAASIFNFFIWKQESKAPIIISIVLYILSLNALSLLICILGILWDSRNEPSILEKKKNPLFIIAGVLGILGMVFWLTPMMKKADSSSGSLSLFTAILEGVFTDNEDNFLFFRVIGMYYLISFLASSVIALAISFVGKLRNNPKKALIAVIFYIFSLSVFSAVLCFIGYAILKKQIAGAKSLETKQDILGTS